MGGRSVIGDVVIPSVQPMDEAKRICGVCDHPKRGHEFPQSEGGAGGGHSGRCVVYSCGCNGFESTSEFKELEYTGFDAPSWVAEGVRLKVKRTPITREYGIQVPGSREHLWPGDVGKIERREGIGWWDWMINFGGGKRLSLTDSELENLMRVRGK